MPARTPEECSALVQANLNSGNLEGLMALYEPSACLVQQDGSPAKTGAALRQSLAAFIAIAATIKTSITKVIRAGDDLAVLYTDWTITATGIPLSGKAVEVMRLQPDGTWKLIIDDPFGRS
jgi:ketosteroid isomerase-like protein